MERRGRCKLDELIVFTSRTLRMQQICAARIYYLQIIIYN